MSTVNASQIQVPLCEDTFRIRFHDSIKEPWMTYEYPKESTHKGVYVRDIIKDFKRTHKLTHEHTVKLIGGGNLFDPFIPMVAFEGETNDLRPYAIVMRECHMRMSGTAFPNETVFNFSFGWRSRKVSDIVWCVGEALKKRCPEKIFNVEITKNGNVLHDSNALIPFTESLANYGLVVNKSTMHYAYENDVMTLELNDVNTKTRTLIQLQELDNKPTLKVSQAGNIAKVICLDRNKYDAIKESFIVTMPSNDYTDDNYESPHFKCIREWGNRLIRLAEKQL